MAGQATAQRGGGRIKKSAKSGRSGPRPRRGGRLRLPRRRGLLLVLIGAVLLGAGAIWVLYGSSWLRVEHVKTTGTQVLTPGEVEAVAAVPIGSPLISVDTGAIEARLRQKLPRIDTVEVVRSWPHGIGLKVTERKPALVMKNGAKFDEVDVKGVRFATVQQPAKGTPLLELAVSQSPSLRRFGTDRLVLEAVRVAGELPPAVAKETRSVKISSYDSVTLELNDGRSVVWGSDEEGGLKGRTLSALMKARPKSTRFDVSAPTAPAVSGS
ncbi:MULTISPECIES: cell division protein FtsQ/DivIB [unclassified Streptomyces]|uniref:cell division protein FtsQ/DivIB n=1 Tax=unclassified Streptomyces TaxID=2593676 RepID=UPI0038046CEC